MYWLIALIPLAISSLAVRMLAIYSLIYVLQCIDYLFAKAEYQKSTMIAELSYGVQR